VNTTIIRKRDSLIVDMERLLMVLKDDQTSHHLPLNLTTVQNKAQNLFNDMKGEKGEAAKDAEFGASHEWFDRFKKRSHPHTRESQLQHPPYSPDLALVTSTCYIC
jgi:hypothetical protein